MSDIFSRWFKRNFSNPQAVILTSFIIAIFFFIWMFGQIVMPLLVALVIAYLLERLVGMLRRMSIPRPVAVVIVFTIFITLSFTILVGIIPLAGKQLENLFADLPEMASKFKDMLMALPDKYPGFVTTEQIESVLQQWGSNFANIGDELVSFSLESFKGIVTIMIYMILVPLLVFFFMKDKRKIIGWLGKRMPDDTQLSTQVWLEVDNQIGAYARGKVIEIFIVGLATYLCFIIFGLNYALLLAVLVGLSVLIPYIGATIVTIPVALVALVQWGANDTFAYLMIAYLVIQALDGNILVPLLFSETNNLHPVAIIAAVLFFGGIWGVWGVFFAIPLATLVVAVINAFDEVKMAKSQENS